MGDFFYPFIYTQYQEDIPVQSTNQPRYFSIPHQVSAVDHPFPQVPLHQGGGCSGWMWIPWGKTGFGCFFLGGEAAKSGKKQPPGTLNNHLLMDWWNNHFLCNDLESSNWNNHKKTGCLEFQAKIYQTMQQSNKQKHWKKKTPRPQTGKWKECINHV